MAIARPLARPLHHVAVIGALAATLTLLPACSRDTPDAVRQPTGSASAQATEYLPGLAADVHLPPPGTAVAPVVLLVPGGGWQTADRSGLTPLALALAGAGIVAVNSTYSTGSEGATFPRPVQDVACAARFAAAQATSAGITPGPLVLLGHSAGGHLAALAATDDGAFSGDCPWPAVPIDGLVGLAGVYDTASFADALVEFFGTDPEADPGTWSAGDPIARVSAGKAPEGLRALLLHGDADDTVPLQQSQAFAAALRGAGVPVELEVLPGVTHADIYTPAKAADRVIAWIREQWPAASPGATG